jgi:hypothetical protein
VIATRAAVLSAVAVTLGLAVVDMARHPAVLQDRAAPVYFVSFVLVWASYVVAALLVTRRPATLGLVFGAVVGGLWVVELWAGNDAGPGILIVLVYRGSILAVLGATVLGGVLGGLRRGNLWDGVSVGLLSGMLSGMLVCAIAVSGGAFSATVGTSDPQALADFQRSQASDLTTFLVSDWLAAGINHLWIGLALGSVGGLIGSALGVAMTSSSLAMPDA